MRAMVPPILQSGAVYKTCLAHVKNVDLFRRLSAISVAIEEAASAYNQKASSANLASIVPCAKGNNEVILGDVTKGELKGLYTAHLVGGGTTQREIYDQLVASAPNRICPFCGFCEVFTLDHYLPKSKFPLYSVLPANLVPACRDCNTGKLASVAKDQNSQTLHPYYDHGSVIADQWLFATVVPTVPPTVEFKVIPPATWPVSLKSRVSSHFVSYGLASRFSVQAATEISPLKSVLERQVARFGKGAIYDYLNDRAECEFKLHPNSWKRAMWQSLATSSWYCNEGFQLS